MKKDTWIETCTPLILCLIKVSACSYPARGESLRREDLCYEYYVWAMLSETVSIVSGFWKNSDQFFIGHPNRFLPKSLFGNCRIICLRFESSGIFAQIESTQVLNFRITNGLFLFLGGEEWKILAEKLGLNPAEILYLDKRTMNPCIELLSYIRSQRLIDVGTLYDALVECGFPVWADMLWKECNIEYVLMNTLNKNREVRTITTKHWKLSRTCCYMCKLFSIDSLPVV